jgi:hypothetical protein
MIKLKKLTHNPFTGELWEGLIYSVNVDTAINILEKNKYNAERYDNTEFRVALGPKYDNSRLSHYSASEYIDEKIVKLLQLTNNLGYMPTYIQYYTYTDAGRNTIAIKYSSRKIKTALIDEQPKILWITFNKKFDDVVSEKDLPDVIYHVANSKNIQSIRNIGLKPASREKLKSHKRRIYFCLSKKDVSILLQHPLFKENNMIVTVETGTLKNITFYYDPDFYGRGIYTHDNIPPKNIIDIFDAAILKK